MKQALQNPKCSRGKPYDSWKQVGKTGADPVQQWHQIQGGINTPLSQLLEKNIFKDVYSTIVVTLFQFNGRTFPKKKKIATFEKIKLFTI